MSYDLPLPLVRIKWTAGLTPDWRLEMDVPKRINNRWINQQETKAIVHSYVNPRRSPNPSYVALADEISKAKAERARWDVLEAWAKRSLGAILNQYPLRTKSQTYEPNTVFFHKDKTTNVVTVWTKQEAWDKYETRDEWQRLRELVDDLGLAEVLFGLANMVATDHPDFKTGIVIREAIVQSGKLILETWKPK